MIRIPYQFELGARTWDVVKVQGGITLNVEPLHGFCDPINAEIYIDDDTPPAYQRTVFWHELVHSILFAMGKDAHDEELVDGIAQGLAQFDKTRKDEDEPEVE